MEYITLNTGNKIPTIGYGTWQMNDSEAADAVEQALSLGYRLIDTAAVYGNEKGVGEGIERSDVEREDMFVTTKLWNDEQGYESAFQAFDDSLDRLGLDYIDLYLIHWPATAQRRESWKALTELYESGRAKNVGVSNYTVRHLEEMKDYTDLVPAVNQVEFHPFLYKEQEELLEYCAAKNIVVEAYSPLARANKLEHDTLQDIGDTYGKTPAQVMLRWCMQQYTVPIPKSADPDRIKENFEVFDFELSGKDMEAINNLSQGMRTGSDPHDMA